jgi:Na+/citrate or Na+/malate symporter
MIKAVIISGFLFIIGNILWSYFNQPKIFYIPLALFMLVLCLWVCDSYGGSNKYVLATFEYFVFLAFGNLVKQIFWSPSMSVIADYYWGGLMTLTLIVRLWVIHKQHSGKKLRSS